MRTLAPNRCASLADGVLRSERLPVSDLVLTIWGKPVNWKMDFLNGDAPFLTPEDCQSYWDCYQQLKILGISQDTDIIVPKMRDCNGRFVHSKYENPKDVFRTPYGLTGGPVFWKNEHSLDGFVLPKRWTAILRTGDCPTSIFRDKVTGKVAIAHCSRNSLLYWNDSSKPVSIVDRVMDYFLSQDVSLQNLDVWITCGIEAEHFPHPVDHPIHGQKNQRMLAYLHEAKMTSCIVGDWAKGQLHLPRIITHQCTNHGLPAEQIHSDEDTLKTFGDESLWSHAEYSLGKCPIDGRNGIIIENR